MGDIFGEVGPGAGGGGAPETPSSPTPETGGSSETISIKFSGKELIDPWDFNQTAFANDLRCKPNGFVNVRGEKPGYGAVLMTKANLDEAIAEATKGQHTLTFTSSTTDGSNTSVTYERLAIYNTRSLTMAGLSARDNDIYLVEFEDVRRQAISASNLSVRRRYNMMKIPGGASSTTEVYYSGTLNSAVVWELDEIVDDLFSTYMDPDFFPSGTEPTIPTGITGFSTHNFSFSGSLWKAFIEMGRRDFFFWNVKPDGTVVYIDPSNLSQTLTDFLDDTYSSRLVYANNDVEAAQKIPQNYYFFFDSYGITIDVTDNDDYATFQSISTDHPDLDYIPDYNVNIYQPQPLFYDNASNAAYPTGWKSTLDTFADNYVDRVGGFFTDIRPIHRIYAGLIDVPVETGVEVIRHYSVGVGPNNQGGFFTSVENSPFHFDSDTRFYKSESEQQRADIIVGKLFADCINAATATLQTVEMYLDGPEISVTTVYNPPITDSGGSPTYLISGSQYDHVICKYHPEEDRYYMIGVIPDP